VKVLVTGGRYFQRDEIVHAALDALLEVHGRRLAICHGDELRGADLRARCWAEANGVAQFRCPANWKVLGSPAAGPIRNGWMIEFFKPDLVLAFPGGRGTADCVAKARAAGIEVREVAP